jgi:SAM-dependent methyltransferase
MAFSGWMARWYHEIFTSIRGNPALHSMAKRKKPTMAERADPYILYQTAVQCPESELDFVEGAFKTLRRRRLVTIREDFCGTAHVACDWVRRRKTHRAIGVDINPAVLAWGEEHNVARLNGNGAKRITLLNADVLKVRTPPVDAVLAMNFSYWILKDRKTLKRYFRRIRDALVADGILFLDVYGGYDAFRVMKERTQCDGFTYVWDQAAYNPVTGESTCHIHFKFDDGSSLKKAFSYTWRIWTLPEIREVLAEAGFNKSTVYWQGSDEETGEGNGEFSPTEMGEPDAGWIAYLVAEK